MKYFFNKSLFFAASLFVGFPVMSLPTSVVVDGIKTANEYTGGLSRGSKDLLWWNGHHSIYDKAANNQNKLFWEIDKNDELYSLSVFFEVPTYARRMIWASGCDYNDSGNEADCAAIDDTYLDAYLEGTHHGSVKMDYQTQTGSEYFELRNDDASIAKIKWQDEDNNGLDDGYTWATSREYLIKNDICDTSLCLEYEMASSIEIMWNLDSQSAVTVLLDSINNMELHLSDEARGLPPVEPEPDPETIPEPSSILLLVLGFIGIFASRKVSR